MDEVLLIFAKVQIQMQMLQIHSLIKSAFVACKTRFTHSLTRLFARSLCMRVHFATLNACTSVKSCEIVQISGLFHIFSGIDTRSLVVVWRKAEI